jgi:hypothetical protein
VGFVTTHRLIKGHSVWLVAHYTNGEPCQAIIKLFETHVFPVCFTQAATENQVLEELTKMGGPVVVRNRALDRGSKWT